MRHTKTPSTSLSWLAVGRAALLAALSVLAVGSFPVIARQPPASSALDTRAAPLEPRAEHASTLLPDGRIAVLGGTRTDGLLASAELWDAATGALATARPLQEKRSRHTATSLDDGRIVVLGGFGRESGRRVVLASGETCVPTQRTHGIRRDSVSHLDGQALAFRASRLEGLYATVEE